MYGLFILPVPSTMSDIKKVLRKSRQMDHLSSGPTWPTGWNPVSTKNTKKIIQAWWQAPVIPATRETEAGESLEPGRWRLQPTKVVPLRSSLGGRVRLHLKTNKQKGTQNRLVKYKWGVFWRICQALTAQPKAFCSSTIDDVLSSSTCL